MSRAKQTHCKRGHERVPENLRPNGTCRTCARDGVRLAYVPHPRKKRTHCRLGHALPLNSKKCKICVSKVNKEQISKRKVKGTFSEAKRKYRLRELGWTPELWNNVWEEQDGRCGICTKVLNLNLIQNESRACADHEHVKPPKPRGILCANCNIMIGQAKDSAKTLLAAILYIEKYQQETKLNVSV